MTGTAPGQQDAHAAETDREQAGEPADAEKAGTGADQSQTMSASPTTATTSVKIHSDHADRRADRITPASPPTAAAHPGRS